MKMSKKLLSLLLCAIMVLGSVAIGGGGFTEVLDAFSVKASATKVTSYSQGDIIEFGWYPQSEETNTSITDALTSSAGNTLGWNSYGYYSGTGEESDGQMTPSDYMRYTDVMYGNTKYRGVVFDSYRPYYTGYQSTTSTSSQHQERNGYTCGNIYWFKYEPLVWRVLDSSTGLVMCESIIDSQAYNNYIWYDTDSDEYYGNEAHTNYANDYYNSSIRKWLTEDFYATAFSESQQNKLLEYNCGNSCPWNSSFDSQNSSDKVFLLSYDEVKNTEYGFNSDLNVYDPARRAKGTDYAKCQGLWVNKSSESEYDGNSRWWLRSPFVYSGSACTVYYDGRSSTSRSVDGTDYGVRPALKLNLTSDIFQSDVTDSDGTGSDDGWADSTHIRFGSYPQTDVTASMGETLDAKATDWKSYKYYSGTGEEADGQMSSADYMMYCDVTVMNGSVPEKYRGVKFSTYRPCWTEDESTTSASTYQDDNGYTVGNTYWFKYEPLVWRVLDSSTGLVMCESIIDSQAYNNYIWYDTDSDEYYGNEAHTNYANDYYNSSIRKWLTEDFYATAFSESQQNKLLEYNCGNSCPWDSSFDSQNSSDKVFLLSYDEVKTTAYGFNSSASNYDPARRAKGTDYAKCQGLFVCNDGSEYDGNSWWWLRSPYSFSGGACVVVGGGSSDGIYCGVDNSSGGVRPALKLNPLEIMKAEAKAELAEAKMNAVSDEAKAAIDTAIENVDKATNPDAVASAKAEGTSNAVNADKALADAKATAKTELETAKNNAVSDEAKAAIDTAIENVDKATNPDAVASAKAEGTSNAAEADEALADAKAAAKTDLAAVKNNAVSDEAKAAIDTAIENVDKATNPDAVASAKAEGTRNAAEADEALADAKAAAKSELSTAKNSAKSDEAKAAIGTAIENVDKATNLDAVASAKAEGTSNAQNADNAYAEKTKFDNVNIKVAGAQTVDYRSIVTIKATATNVPDDCKLAIYLGSQKVAEGDNKSVSYEYGEIKSDINYTVKVIDANGKVQKDSNGKELTKDGGKITCNAGFFKKLIAFFKGLFKSLSKVEVKP